MNENLRTNLLRRQATRVKREYLHRLLSTLTWMEMAQSTPLSSRRPLRRSESSFPLNKSLPNSSSTMISMEMEPSTQRSSLDFYSEPSNEQAPFHRKLGLLPTIFYSKNLETSSSQEVLEALLDWVSHSRSWTTTTRSLSTSTNSLKL